MRKAAYVKYSNVFYLPSPVVNYIRNNQNLFEKHKDYPQLDVEMQTLMPQLIILKYYYDYDVR